MDHVKRGERLRILQAALCTQDEKKASPAILGSISANDLEIINSNAEDKGGNESFAPSDADDGGSCCLAPRQVGVGWWWGRYSTPEQLVNRTSP